jgi:hypothetical protein
MTYGWGRILAEWGAFEVRDGGNPSVTGQGIYDVVFGIQPHQFLHCCRAEYLQKIQ